MPKTVLITGANKGIGLAIVRSVLEADEEVHVLLGARSPARGEAAKAKLIGDEGSFEGRVDVVALDVSSDDSVRSAAVEIEERAPLYGIVNNAGIGFGQDSMERILEVNTRGPHRVCSALLGAVVAGGRIVNVSSASGPNFVAACSAQQQARFLDPTITWAEIDALMKECLEIEATTGEFAAAGFGGGDAYGLSKALLNAYTVALARDTPQLTINACTPGFIDTDLTRPYAESRGVPPAELGMNPPAHGARTPTLLLLGEVRGSGWYFGSDGVRSPLDRYRSPGDPPYTGE